MFLEIFLFFILFIVIYTFYNQDPPDYPPGPFRIPIIGGSLPNNHERVIKMQKKYGDLLLDKLGQIYWLTICDYKLCKEALSKTELANRPQLDVIKTMSEGKIKGVGNTNGEHWRTNRRFVIHYLRDSGMGKTFLEDSIHVEAKEIVAEFNRLNGQTTNLTFLNFAPLNVIWKIVAGKRYDVNDPMLDTVQQLNQDFAKSLPWLILLDFIPVLKYIIPKSISKYVLKQESLFLFFGKLRSITQPLIDEHKEKLDRGNPKDLMDMYSLEEENCKELIEEHVSDDDLRSITMDLFNAGSDTVSITLRWAILFMAKHPHIQTKMQEEIDRALPRDTLPGNEHKSQLPYCEAVVHEVLRKSSLTPSGGVRKTFEELCIGGYRIPKNTIVSPAASLIHHDTRYWTNPYEFMPERFIDDNGKFFCPKEGFLPFGLGKRQCIGEGLARAELFIFITTIFQKFSFCAPEGKNININFVKDSLIFHIPENQDVLVRARN